MSDIAHEFLSKDDNEGLHRAVGRILEGPDPALLLRGAIGSLNSRSRPDLCRRLFESVYLRSDVVDYWVYYNMVEVYYTLGERAAAAMAAMRAMHLVPSEPGWHIYKHLFDIFTENQRYEDALVVLAKQIERQPDNPIATVEECRRLAGLSKIPPPSLIAELVEAEPAQGSSNRDVVSLPPEPPLLFEYAGDFGTGRPACMPKQGELLQRPTLRAVHLKNATVSIFNNSTLVRDDLGVLQDDLSICRIPAMIEREISRLEPDQIHVSRSDTVVLINDVFPAPNICHFLFDQLPRLHLYTQVGIDLAQATVIGPPLSAQYQKALIAKTPVKNYIPTNRAASVQADDLWILSSCKIDHRHPAQFGSPAILSWIRSLYPDPPRGEPRKIYISRADASSRFVVNEDEVFARLEPFGFEKMVLSEISFEDAVEAFKSAVSVVSIHGAGLTHIAFCPPGARILECFHPMYGTMSYAPSAISIGLEYATMVAWDASSDDAYFNDPNLAQGRNFGISSIRIDLPALDRWLRER